jgi:WD40 repeat protein
MAVDPARAKSLFLAALEQSSPAGRAAWLDRECGPDAELRARVEALLAADGGAGPMLPSQAAGVAESGAAAIREALGPYVAKDPLASEQVTVDQGAGEVAAIGYARPARGVGGFMSGQTIAGRYTLRELLGEGGMGSVYRADQTQPVRRQVALKLVRVGKDSRAVLARFDAERQALALMDHPNIARVYDGGATDAGQPYFVMELVSGVPITRFCDQHRLDVRARLELFIPVCQAVQHAHQKGVIHRDLKPGNVLVTEVDGRPTPKVIDFGIAKATEFDLTDRSLADTGAIVGTPAYMSPEQADPSSMDIDTRTDVYALGVMLYELLTGSPPIDASEFKRGAILEMLRMVREVDPPWPSTRVSTAQGLPGIAATRDIDRLRLKRQLRGDLDWIVMKALEKDRTRRYETASGFAADVLRHLTCEPVLAAPPSRAYRLQKFVRKNRGPVVAAGLLVLALLGGIAGTTFGLIRANRARAQAVSQQIRAENGEKLAGERLVQVEAETKNAIEQKTRAQASESRARASENKALEERNRAQLSRADAMVALADAMAGSNRLFEAEGLYKEAYEQYQHLRVPPFRAAVGLSMAYAVSPPPLVTFRGHNSWVFGVSISPDGRIALSGCQDQFLRVWDLSTGITVRTLAARSGVDAVAICPDGRTALSSHDDRTLRLWDLVSGNEIRRLQATTAVVRSIAVSSDGHTALTGDDDKAVVLWDLAAARPIYSFLGHQAGVTAVAYSPDGHTGVSVGTDEMLKFWDLSSGGEIRTLQGATLCVALSPDGHSALTATAQRNTLCQWDLTTGQVVRTFQGHRDDVLSVAFAPDGRTALSGSGDHLLKCWDLASGRELTSFQCQARCRSIAVTPDGRAVVAVDTPFVQLWPLSPGNESRTLRGESPVRCIAVSPDGRTALAGGDDRRVTLWDLATGKEITSVVADTNSVRSVAFSPDGHLALSGGDDAIVRLWDLQTGALRQTMPGHAGPVSGLAFSPDGETALSASADKTIKLWQLSTGREMRTLSGHSGAVNCIAFSRDGRAAISGSQDNTLKIWDVSQGKEIQTLRGHPEEVFCVAVSPDGRTALSGSRDTTLKLWDLSTGKQLRTLRGHVHYVQGVAYSPDGRIAVSGGSDKSLKLWDLDSGKEIRALQGHTGWVTGVAFGPDGLCVLSGSEDHTLRLWDFSKAQTFLDFDTAVQTAQSELAKDPGDPSALAVLGEWYAFRHASDRAIDFLAKARAAGAHFDPLQLGRCYWEMSDDLPAGGPYTRAGCLAAAAQGYDAALVASKDAKNEFYLQLCLRAVRRAAATGPTTAPGPSPSSQPATGQTP